MADSGFKVEPNGFSFANYGGEEGYKNLNSNQMRRLYGSAVCLTGKGSGCVLNPAARSWMQQMNTAMGGGHCYGFAALTWMMQRGQLARFGYPSLDTFGGGLNAFDLKIEGNPKLQSAIARAFVLQAMPSVINKMIEGTPTEILQALLTRLTPNNRETYTMTIFQPGFEAGHAITPISVEDQGDEIGRAHV